MDEKKTAAQVILEARQMTHDLITDLIALNNGDPEVPYGPDLTEAIKKAERIFGTLNEV